MSRAWLDKLDNPGMAEWDLRSEDIYGALLCVNLAELCFRVGFTKDFEVFAPVTGLDQLLDLTWLADAPLAEPTLAPGTHPPPEGATATATGATWSKPIRGDRRSLRGGHGDLG